MIEAMCLVCHGPIPRKGRGRGITACTCHDNCRGYWRRMARGEPISDRYLHIRWLHAYRREQMAILERTMGAANLLARWWEGLG